MCGVGRGYRLCLHNIPKGTDIQTDMQTESWTKYLKDVLAKIVCEREYKTDFCGHRSAEIDTTVKARSNDSWIFFFFFVVV